MTPQSDMKKKLSPNVGNITTHEKFHSTYQILILLISRALSWNLSTPPKQTRIATTDHSHTAIHIRYFNIIKSVTELYFYIENSFYHDTAFINTIIIRVIMFNARFNAIVYFANIVIKVIFIILFFGSIRYCVGNWSENRQSIGKSVVVP